LALVLAITPLAEAQRGRGRGFFGRAFTVSKVNLASAEQNQAALKMSAEQKTKVTEIAEAYQTESRELRQDAGGDRAAIREDMQELNNETNEKLMAALDEAQQKRLGELYIQANGASLLTTDEKLQESLKVTADQKAKLAEVSEANGEAMREAFQDFQDLSQEERREAFAKQRAEANEKLLAVLTEEQRGAFGKMQGEKMELDMTQLGGRGFGRGGRGGRGQN
jgi:hypothetical protein